MDGYEGPWREYVDQIKVSKPTEKQLAILEEQFGDKQKNKKEKDETIDESSMLHGECVWMGIYGRSISLDTVSMHIPLERI